MGMFNLWNLAIVCLAILEDYYFKISVHSMIEPLDAQFGYPTLIKYLNIFIFHVICFLSFFLWWKQQKWKSISILQFITASNIVLKMELSLSRLFGWFPQGSGTLCLPTEGKLWSVWFWFKVMCQISKLEV